MGKEIKTCATIPSIGKEKTSNYQPAELLKIKTVRKYERCLLLQMHWQRNNKSNTMNNQSHGKLI